MVDGEGGEVGSSREYRRSNPLVFSLSRSQACAVTSSRVPGSASDQCTIEDLRILANSTLACASGWS